MTKDWTDLPIEERAASSAQSPAPQKPVLTNPQKSYSWVSWFVFAFVVFGWRAYEHQKQINKLNRMAKLVASHEAREGALDAGILKDDRLYLPEIRERYRAYTVADCAEGDRYAQDMRDANDGKMFPVNQANYDAELKVCKDTTTLLDTMDRATWVPGVDGTSVIKEDDLRTRTRDEAQTLDVDLKALSVSMATADKEYKQEQTDGRK